MIVGRLTGDPRHLLLLDRKLMAYRGYVVSDEFKAEFGGAGVPRSKIHIRVDEAPDAEVLR